MFQSTSKSPFSYLALCLMALASLAILLGLPESQRDFLAFNHQVAAHFLLEVFAIVVALMIASLAWHERDPEQQDMAKLLLLGFTLVAGFDILHLLNSTGMPGLITSGNIEKSRFFWVCGRLAEIFTLFLLGLRASLPGRKLWWLLLAMASGGLLFWLGTFHVHTWWGLELAQTQVSSPFSIMELLICIANFACAALFFIQWQQLKDRYYLHLAATCFIIGVGDLAFLKYFSSSQVLDLGGHLLKVMAYGLLYYGFYQARIIEPYRKIKTMKKVSQEAQQEWENIWQHMPVEVIVLDSKFNYKKATPPHAQRLRRSEGELQGKPWEKFANQSHKSVIMPRLKSLEAGRAVDFEIEVSGDNADERLLKVASIPFENKQGEFDGLIAVFLDITEKYAALKLLEDSYKDLNDLKAALDAHAIVAVTNAQGIITKANDKFCQISQYPRGELIGQDHRILKSGYHPKKFFKEMWQTITAGKVWTGEVCNRAKDGTLYWVHTTIVPFIGEDGVPEQYIAIRANITDRKNAEQRSHTMALYDMLTGLPNRRLLGDKLRMLSVSTAHGKQFNALLLLDLDHFKDVNDSLGHSQGDELLRQAAARIRSTVREEDVVARLGGDEFVVLLGDLDTDPQRAQAEAERVAEKIRYSLEEVFDFEGLLVHTSSSIGIALFQGKDASQEEILKQADMALYRAKERGRNQVCVFEPSMEEEMLSHATLMHDLRLALTKNQLKVFYQVVVNTAERTTGYEALLRWPHPEQGMVSPAIFIPKAEQSGLIVGIGRWVLQQACEQLVIWANQSETAGLTISVNISARQLRDPDFYNSVEQALRKSGAKPSLLCLELTESMFHTDLPQTIHKMKKLRQLGVKFSLDDFGTGYSSLSYLKRLPLNELKIDKSFVDDILIDDNAAAIAKTILALAQSLQLTVVAEGIELREQFEWLREQGCHRFQGYHFGKPLPVESLPLPGVSS